MNFLEDLGFKLFALGMSDTWCFFHKGEVIFKATQTLSGKMLISNSSDKILLSTRDKLEMITFLTSELRDFKIDKLL